MASSIDYVPVDIDMLDDPKVSALLNDLSDGDPAARFAASARSSASFPFGTPRTQSAVS